ncbi:hypothetical protein FOS14_14375 [Skermania sp. ID1734]|uniref:hypothetical protein n=1 Tax=Skermania sp. ID1734 TaxID=2597516 RepID=UPI00118156DE|nr:hypothetical protein [Skermania sp. ID1734]TSD98167.1 hypothetical protein FOS14_14375 [Skermania sp. ID1734]
MNTPNIPPRFSYGKLAVLSIGAAMIVLLITAIIIGIVRPGPDVGLGIAVAGVIAAIVAMGTVATRITNRAFKDVDGSDQRPHE